LNFGKNEDFEDFLFFLNPPFPPSIVHVRRTGNSPLRRGDAEGRGVRIKDGENIRLLLYFTKEGNSRFAFLSWVPDKVSGRMLVREESEVLLLWEKRR